MTAGMYNTSPRLLLGYRVLAAMVMPVGAWLLLGASEHAADHDDHLLTIPAGWMLPMTVVRRRGRLRLMEIDRRLPDSDRPAVRDGGGRSGLSRRDADVAADRFKPPLGDELRLMLQEQTMGLVRWRMRWATYRGPSAHAGDEVVRARDGQRRADGHLDGPDHAQPLARDATDAAGAAPRSAPRRRRCGCCSRSRS